MSQENVEIVRRATEASQRHDNETALSLYDPEVEMEQRGFDGSVEVYRGLDGVRAWFRDLLDPLAHVMVTVDEWIDAGDDVIAVVHTTGRGRKSGVPFEHRDAHVWTLRDGKLWHLSIYPTRDEALKAVGLEAQAVWEENVEIVMASINAYNAGDMDAWSALVAPNVIWRVMPDWPEQGPFIGRDAVLRQVRQLRESWDSDAVVPLGDLIDAGDQVVLRQIWRGVGHGPESNMEMTCIYTVREDTIIAFEFFWDHAEALKVVGLQE